jgi:hypothetical protein
MDKQTLADVLAEVPEQDSGQTSDEYTASLGNHSRKPKSRPNGYALKQDPALLKDQPKKREGQIEWQAKQAERLQIKELQLVKILAVAEGFLHLLKDGGVYVDSADINRLARVFANIRKDLELDVGPEERERLHTAKSSVTLANHLIDQPCEAPEDGLIAALQEELERLERRRAARRTC